MWSLMAERGSSLEEVLRGIPPEKLDQPCQDKHLSEIARHVTNWLSLAPFLGISEAEENDILENWPRNTAKQKIDFLRKWQENHGRKATYRRLCKAFLKVGKQVLAEKVCDVLNSQSSSSSDSSEGEDSSLTPSPPPAKKVKSSSTTEGKSSLTPSLAMKQQSRSKEVAHPLDAHAQYLCDMYGRMRPQFLVLQWPPPPTRKVFNLAMIHSKTVQTGPVDEELVRLLQRGNVADFVKERKSVQLHDLFSLDNEDRKIILIEGAPGSGKSTLAWHACLQWKAGKLFQEFRIVVFVQLRDWRVQSAQSIADLLPAGSEQKRRAAAEAIQDCEGRGVLFVMDGWDEYEPGLRTDSIVDKLICKSDELDVPYSTLLITSRAIASAALQQLASSRVEIVGFTPEEVSQYFQEVVKDPVALQALQEQLKDLPVIEASCYLPLNAAIVAHLFLGLNHTLPRTLHEVFSALVCGCIVRHLTKQSGKIGNIPQIPSLNKLPSEVQVPFKNICKLAYEASMKNKATFSSEDLSLYEVSVEGDGLGLMQVVQSFLSGKSESYHFLHLSVQELLAAVHVSKLEAVKQVNVFRELFSEPRLVSVFRFYAALTKLEMEGTREVIARVIGRSPLSLEDMQWRQHVLNVLHCLYEAQDVSLCLFVAHLLNGVLDLSEITLSPLDCLCVGYFLCSLCTSTKGEFGVCLMYCGLKSYSFGFLVKELGKCPAGSGVGGGNNAVMGCLGLDLGSNDIDGNGVHLVCDLMMSNPSMIRRLDLNTNSKIQDHDEDGLLCLFRMLCSNQWLVEVNLEGCNLTINAENGPVLVEMLHKNLTLKELVLSDNRIGDFGVGYIAGGMIANRGVVRLVLTECGISEEGGKSLGIMLTENKTLKHLNINGNGFGDIGVGCIVEGMSEVAKLVLSDCDFKEEGSKALGSMLAKDTALELLDIGCNIIGMGYIAEGMIANSRVVRLKLWMCGIGEEGCKSLGGMLTENTTLRNLDLGGNIIGDTGMRYIAEGMIVNSGVTRLKLWACGIGEEGGKSLGRMLAENRNLEHLDIDRNEGLGDVGVLGVSEGLRVNCRLEKLKMRKCGYSLDCLKLFVLGLKENRHLRRLRVEDKEEVQSLVEEGAAVNHLRRQRGEAELQITLHSQ